MDTDYESILPPNWVKHGAEYLNTLTNQSTDKHPLQIYFEVRDELLPNHEQLWKDFYATQNNTTQLSPTSKLEEFAPLPSPISLLDNPKASKLDPISDKYIKNTIVYDEYYCKWSERDLFGKVEMHGLTIRYIEKDEEEKIVVKFEGLNAEWIFSSLEGPYGPVTKHDLYIGSKLKIFGRNITISGANPKACIWITKEFHRLEKQKDELIKQIKTVGEIPVVVKPQYKEVQRNITRELKLPGQCNLRKLLIQNNRLREQIATLGLYPNIKF